MTTPDRGNQNAGPDEWPETDVPPANPAYSTPPPEGPPDADTQ